MKAKEIRSTDKNTINEKIIELKKEIAEAQQIFNDFKSKEDLQLQIKKQLDLIVPEIANQQSILVA